MIKNCPECGKLFVLTLFDTCEECQKVEDEQYDLVYRYLRENPNSSFDVVSQDTGVRKSKILKFLREGRITATRITVEDKISCLSCGKKVEKGKLCPKCTDGFKGKISSVKKEGKTTEELKDRKPSKVYIADRIRKRGEERR